MRKLLNKWKTLPNSVKSSIAFVFSSLIVKGCVFIVTPIFTRIMDINDYGIVTTYNSWISIIEIFAILGLTSAGVFNVGLKDNKETRNEYISSCLGLCNLTTLIVFCIIVVLKLFLGENFILENKYLFIMFIHFLFNPAQIFWITRQRYEYKYKFPTIITISSVIISQLISIIFVLVFKNDTSFYKILGRELGVLIFTIPIYIILLKKGKDYINLKRWKNILVLAIPLIPHYLSQHIMDSSDKIMISNMVNAGDAAIYGVVANISMIGTIFWNAINASLIPYTFDKIENKKFKDIDNLCKKLLVGYTVILFMIILLAPEILSILAPTNYHKGIYCVPPLTFVIFMHALYNLFANIEFYNKKTKNIAFATVLATIINLILNYIFIPKYSFIAASYTTLVANIVLVFCHYLSYKKTETNKIYDSKFILLLSTIFLIFIGLCNILYLNNYIRYSFMLLILLFIFIKRKELISSIKTVMKKK